MRARMRRRTRFGAAAIVAAAATMMAGGTAWAGTLDQQQTQSNNQAAIFEGGGGSEQSLAQTFTAGISGGLDQVDLSVFKTNGPTAPLTVEIRNVVGGVPGPSVLASGTILPAAVGTTAAFLPATFPVPAPVTAGTQYAIVAWTSSVSPDTYGWRTQSTGNVYPAGSHFFQNDSPPEPAWTSTSSADAAFKTYVIPSPPSSTGLRAAALKKCKKKKSKKARKKCKKKAKKLPV
jgi:hypothetical protein